MDLLINPDKELQSLLHGIRAAFTIDVKKQYSPTDIMSKDILNDHESIIRWV